MAASDVSSRLDFLEIDGNNTLDGMNVDEILEATIEEGTGEEGVNGERDARPNPRIYRRLPTNLYEERRSS